MAADVIVVGAGWGGLTTAAILAHNGLDVRVLEATGHIGGRSACDRKDGFIVDYGIHIIGYESQGPAAKALREIGYDIEFTHYTKPVLYLDGEFVPMPTGTPAFLKSRMFSFTDKIILGHGLRRLLMARSEKLEDTPLVDRIAGLSRKPVRDFFRVLCSTGLVTPDIEVASAGEFSKFMKRAMTAREQVSYPVGGMAQINEALAAKIGESGGITFNSRVKNIEIEGGRVGKVKVHDEELEARAVVAAVPVQKLPELTDGGLPADLKQKCSSLIPTSGISIDLCLGKKVSDIDSFIVSTDPITMGQFTSNIDPTTAPEGKQLATFFYPLPQAIINDRALLDEEQRRFLELLEKMFPGIMDNVEWERVLRMKLVDGFEPRIAQTAKDRPGVRVDGVDNLFLSGDCVGVPGKGGDVAFTSGIAAAHAVLDYLK